MESGLRMHTGRADALHRVRALDSLMLNGPAANDASSYAHSALARLYSQLGHPTEALAGEPEFHRPGPNGAHHPGHDEERLLLS